jgi:hypothetical protein
VWRRRGVGGAVRGPGRRGGGRGLGCGLGGGFGLGLKQSLANSRSVGYISAPFRIMVVLKVIIYFLFLLVSFISEHFFRIFYNRNRSRTEKYSFNRKVCNAAELRRLIFR